MTTPTTSRSRRRWRNAALGLLGLVALWGIVGGLLLPALAKKMLAEKGGEALGRVVQVDDVSVNPYTLDATLKGVRVLEADGKTTFVSFSQLDVEASGASFYRFAPVIDRLTLAGLKVNLVRDGENHYNLSDILTRLQAEAKKQEAARKQKGGEPEEPARFSVSNIRLVNAAVDFDDRPVGRKHQVSDVHFSVPFVSNLPRHLKEYVEPSFAAKVNGAPILVTGETLPFGDTLQTRFILDVSALDVRRYIEYVPVPLPVKVESGTLDAHITVSFTQAPRKDPLVVVAGTAGLRDVAVANAGGRLAAFSRLEADLASFDPMAGLAKVSAVRLENATGMEEQVRIAGAQASDIAVDLKKKTARIASVTTSGGSASLKRGRDGALELPDLGTANAPAPAETPVAASSEKSSWKVVVGKIDLSDYQVTLADAAVKPAVTHKVSISSLQVEELSTEDGLRGKALAKLGLDRGATVDVDATFALEPLLVTAKVDARRIDLVPLRPYMTQFSTVVLKSGAASARGTLTLKGKADALNVAYHGGAEVANFATVDTTSREDLLSFKAVRTNGIEFALAPNAPFTLAVADIVVDRVYSRLVLNADGKFNVQQLRTATPEAPEAPAATNPDPRPRNVRIDRISFVDSRLNFTDLFIKPNYSADVGELQGTITHLSSDPASRGVVDLKGRYDATSPVVIAGEVNPLRGDLFVDIGAKGEGIELPKLTAYSQRYAGYGIKEGKLTLDVKYHIDQGKLEGRNKILIERLTFGDKVESPDATTLPVLFAVNLLKDSKGEIALELPISGSLADHKFEIGGLITQVLGSLLKKAVTNPFGLIAAAFGGSGGGNGGGGTGAGASAGAPGAAGSAPSGDDLKFVEFTPGRSEVGEAGQRKLAVMARALQGRPGLTLEMAPRFDAEGDLKALRYAALQSSIAGEGKPAVAEAEYAKAVRAAYAREKLPGDPAQMSVAAMETGLMDKLAIGEEQLKALSAARSAAVRGYLVDQGQLPQERVVMAAAGSGAEPPSARASRVEFALR